MSNPDRWQGLPYNAISCFYRKTFGNRVYKIPVGVAETCPNREGIRGMKTCIFCDQWGSAAFPEYREATLRQQIEQARERVRLRFNGDTFLIYFQAYTTTFGRASQLSEQFSVSLSYPEVKGVVVGTRPDCLSPSVLDLWRETSENGTFVGVELGVQSFDNRQLEWMRRGHDSSKSLAAIEKIRTKAPKVNLGIHLMFGLPNETTEDILHTAKMVNSLPLDNVKLHNLHVLKGTPLAEQYQNGLFSPISREEYIRRVVLFLEHLNPETAVHRLAAVASRYEELVAPAWARSKMETYQMTLDEFTRQETFQGRAFQALPRLSPEARLRP